LIGKKGKNEDKVSDLGREEYQEKRRPKNLIVLDYFFSS